MTAGFVNMFFAGTAFCFLRDIIKTAAYKAAAVLNMRFVGNVPMQDIGQYHLVSIFFSISAGLPEYSIAV